MSPETGCTSSGTAGAPHGPGAGGHVAQVRAAHQGERQPHSLIYHRRGNDKIARGFKNSFSRVCKPHFIGVWDTVASVGWLSRRQFSNEILNPDVANGYQALAIDERRHHFRVSRWDECRIPEGQTIEQVWFLGSHGDVGGQDADRGISDITLKWMLGHAKEKSFC